MEEVRLQKGWVYGRSFVKARAPYVLPCPHSLSLVLHIISVSYKRGFGENHVCSSDHIWLKWPIIESFTVVNVLVTWLKRKGYFHSSNLI